MPLWPLSLPSLLPSLIGVWDLTLPAAFAAQVIEENRTRQVEQDMGQWKILLLLIQGEETRQQLPVALSPPLSHAHDTPLRAAPSLSSPLSPCLSEGTFA